MPHAISAIATAPRDAGKLKLFVKPRIFLINLVFACSRLINHELNGLIRVFHYIESCSCWRQKAGPHVKLKLFVIK